MRKTGFDENWMKRIEELTGKEIGKTEDMMLHLEQQNQYLLKLITGVSSSISISISSAIFMLE